MFIHALLVNVPTAPGSWLTALGNAWVLIAVWSLGLAVYIAVILRWRKRRRDAEPLAGEEDQSFATLPDDGQSITVYPKKSELALYIVQLSLSTSINIAFYAWLWSHSQYQTGVIVRAIFGLICGAILLSIVIRLLFSVARLFSHTPILIVDAAGITDNATFIGAGMGLIPWHEIRQFFIYDRGIYSRGSFLQILSMRTLIIVAKNQTLVRQRPLWKRWLHSFNISPSHVVRIPEFLFSMPLEEVRAQIEEYARTHGQTLWRPSWMPAVASPAGPSTSAD